MALGWVLELEHHSFLLTDSQKFFGVANTSLILRQELPCLHLLRPFRHESPLDQLCVHV